MVPETAFSKNMNIWKEWSTDLNWQVSDPNTFEIHVVNHKMYDVYSIASIGRRWS